MLVVCDSPVNQFYYYFSFTKEKTSFLVDDLIPGDKLELEVSDSTNIIKIPRNILLAFSH